MRSAEDVRRLCRQINSDDGSIVTQGWQPIRLIQTPTAKTQFPTTPNAQTPTPNNLQPKVGSWELGVVGRWQLGVGS